MSKLSERINIGKVLESNLNSVGIESYEDLTKLGSEEAFLKLQMFGHDPCMNTLCALEGAIEGIRWHDLPKEKKENLKLFFKSTK
ncbi:MAG: TfoX/Sxy family protein [Bacteroidales bacterium]|jgi:DNA transformation protein|nr:TfoX/Sxy family protein [Bacteroidales bacterium]